MRYVCVALHPLSHAEGNIAPGDEVELEDAVAAPFVERGQLLPLHDPPSAAPSAFPTAPPVDRTPAPSPTPAQRQAAPALPEEKNL